MQGSAPSFPEMLLFVVVALGCARAWITMVVRLVRGETLVPYTPRRPAPWTVIDVVIIVLGFVLLGSAFSALNQMTDKWFGPELVFAEARPAFDAIDRLTVSVQTGIVTVPCAIALLMVARGATRNDLGMEKGRFGSDLWLGAVGFAAISVPIYGLQFALTQLVAPSRHPIVDILRVESHPIVMLFVGISAVLIAPVTEEFLFRVVLQGWLEGWEMRYFRRRAGAAYSADFAPAVVDDHAQSRRSGLALTDPSPGQAPTDASSGQALTYGADVAPEAEAGAVQPVETANPYQSPELPGMELTPSASEAATLPGRGFGGLPAGIVPVVATSVLFALLHYGHGPDPIPIFFLSLALGYLYQRTHRVVPGIVLHMCLNGVSMLIFWLGPALE